MRLAPAFVTENKKDFVVILRNFRRPPLVAFYTDLFSLSSEVRGSLLFQGRQTDSSYVLLLPIKWTIPYCTFSCASFLFRVWLRKRSFWLFYMNCVLILSRRPLPPEKIISRTRRSVYFCFLGAPLADFFPTMSRQSFSALEKGAQWEQHTP